jgi:hypothetical protein
MTMKEWKPFNAECDVCGGRSVEVLTECSFPMHAYDGDSARCTECKGIGTVIIEEEGDSPSNIVLWNQ